MEKRNPELALAALQDVKDNPEEWDQSRWRCGSKGCYAWHVARNAGAVWKYATSKDARNPGDFEIVVAPDGADWVVNEYAAQALGFDLDRYEDDLQSWALFRPGNDLARLERAVQLYARGDNLLGLTEEGEERSCAAFVR